MKSLDKIRAISCASMAVHEFCVVARCGVVWRDPGLYS